MNAAASGLIEAIKYAFGSDPYTYPPGPNGSDWDYIPSGATSWYKYGSGGVSSWGSLCGVPNGCIAVLNLMNWHSTFAEQIMLYSCQTEFPLKGLHDIYLSDPWQTDNTQPDYLGPEPMPDDEVLAYTTALSPLCHVSVSKWAYAAGVDLSEPNTYGTAHKTDRCAKVAASVASFTAGLINDGITSPLTLPTQTNACISCHPTHSATLFFAAQQGKMDCMECHIPIPGVTHGGKRLIIEDVWTADGGGTAKSIFSAGNSIQVKIQFSVTGGGSCYVMAYDTYGEIPGVKKMLNRSGTYMTGNVYEWTWSAIIPGSCTPGNGRIHADLLMMDAPGGRVIDRSQKDCLLKIV
jgi:hypothetical protein